MQHVDVRLLGMFAVTVDGVPVQPVVIGEGDRDVVLVPGYVSNVEHLWEIPTGRRILTRLAARARLIIWDKRGTGQSDPVAAVPTLEERALDLTAVLDAACAGPAVLFGVSAGGPMSLHDAAAHPERVAALALYGTAPCFLRDERCPSGWDPEAVGPLLDRLRDRWGTGTLLHLFAPTRAGDPASREAFARFQRAGASPSMGRAMAAAMLAMDVRDLLPAIRVPTLVLHRGGDRLIDPSGGRDIAAHVAGATYVELGGMDHFPFLGDMDDVIDEVEAFIDGLPRAPRRGGASAA